MNRHERDIKRLGEDLSRLRLNVGLSIRQLSVRTGIPPGTLGGYFAGRHAPPANRPEVLESILAECGVCEADRFAWHERIQDIHLGRRRPAVLTSPYRGLTPYRVEDKELYFGREEEVDRLVQIAEAAIGSDLPVVCVVGASASGKSSLVRAGLLARLGEDNPRMRHTVIDLAAVPTVELPDVPAALQVLVLDQVEGLLVDGDGLGVPHSGVDGLSPALDWSQAGSHGSRLLVLVLRADIYPFVAQDPRVRRALQEHQVVLSLLDSAGLQRIIEGPAQQSGLELEEGLTDLILADSRTEGGQPLPHLSYLLAQMWRASDCRVLTIRDYRELGGFEGAIRVAAESAYEELEPQQQERARRLLLTMVVIHPEMGPVRRRARPDEEGLQILAHFVDRYLVLVVDDGVELSHEALLRSWPRMREWIERDRIRLTATGSVARAATEWEASGRDGALLLSGGQLQAAMAYLEVDELSPTESAFVTKSQAAANEERQREARRLRRSRQAVAGLTVLTLISVALLGNTLVARGNAERAQLVAESREIASYAENLRDTDEPVSAYLAAAAVQRDDNVRTRSTLVESSVGSGLARYHLDESPRSVASWSDGAGIAVLGLDGEVVVATDTQSGVTETARIPHPLSEAPPTFGLSASREGEVLAVADGSDRIRLLDVRDPTAPAQIASLEVPLGSNDVEVTPTGDRLIASLGAEGVSVWQRDDDAWAELPQEDGLEGAATNVSISDDGSLLAAVSDAGEVMLWSDTSGELIARAQKQVSDLGLFAVDISPDQDRLAVVGADRIVHVYRINGGDLELETELAEFTTWVNDVRFSRAGDLLVAGSSNRDIKAWEVRSDGISPSPAYTVTLPNEVLRLREGADGEWLFIDNGDQTYRWDVVGRRLPNHQGIVFISRFARDTPIMLTQAGLGDDRTRLWDATDPAEPTPLAEMGSPGGIDVPSGASDISPDGRWVIAGTRDGHALVWDLSSPSEPELALTARVGAGLVGGVSFAEDGSWAVAVAGPELRVMELTSAGPVLGDRVEFEESIAAVDAGTDHVALALSVGDVALYRRDSWEQPVGTFPTDGLAWEAKFGPEEQEMYVAGTDQVVQIVDTSDPADPALLDTLAGPRSSINATDLSPDGDRLAAAVLDGTTWVWRRGEDGWTTDVRLSMPTPQIMSVGWHPIEPALVTGGHNGVVAVASVDQQKVLSEVCASHGDALTQEEWATALPDLRFDPPCSDVDS